jgi:hypothetical protein
MSISGKYNVVGSANNTKILYNSDYDLQTHAEGNLEHICEKFKQIFKEAKENPDVFITDFKCGAVNKEPLRWSYEDVMKGFKKIGDNKISLMDAIKMKDMIKLDMVAFVNCVAVEFSDVYFFKVDGKHMHGKISAKSEQDALAKSAQEFYDSKMYYKYLKRIYSVAIIKNNLKRIKLLNEYFNSIVGFCAKCSSDLEILELLLDCKFKKVKLSDIHNNLQIVKQKLSTCREIEHKSFSDKIDVMCHINDPKKLKKEIHKIVEYLQEIINLNAHNFLKKHKL